MIIRALLITIAVIVIVITFLTYLMVSNSRFNCEQIETLKAAQREEAYEDYLRGPETVRLLRLEWTPEIEQRIYGDYHQTLRRFEAAECKGFFG